jgi:tetratricopeptide (TPR) repeat protein
MYKLKPLHAAAIPASLAKVERYRLLNEPDQAESICRDILECDPANQQAIISLILTLSDQFGKRPRLVDEALEATSRIHSEYERAYYAGMVWERRARARHEMGGYGGNAIVHNWYLEAMRVYEQAEAIRPEGNDDVLLRWNTCARFLHAHPEVCPEQDGAYVPQMLE